MATNQKPTCPEGGYHQFYAGVCMKCGLTARARKAQRQAALKITNRKPRARTK
jgi:hypothetical protein